jgi:hypothetical protein
MCQNLICWFEFCMFRTNKDKIDRNKSCKNLNHHFERQLVPGSPIWCVSRTGT